MTKTAILSLRLSHFRSYGTAALQTGGDSVAFFGPNGAGKTNLLEAASLLVPGRGLRRAATEELIRVPERLGWKIVAEIATPGGSSEIVTAAEGPEATRRTVLIDDKAAPQTALGALVRQVWLTPAMDRLWAEGPGDRRRFLDRVTLGFVPEHGETALAYEKAMRERNRLLKERPGHRAWLAALEGQMARAGARMARARAEALARLSAAQSPSQCAPSLFPRADLSILGSMEARFSERIRRRRRGRPAGQRRGRGRRRLWPSAGGGARPRRRRRTDAGGAAPLGSRCRLCREEHAGARLLDRRAEGAADLALPRQYAGAGRGDGRRPDPADGRGRGASGQRPAARAL